MMNEEIPQLLKNLRLRKIAEMVEGELVAARKASPSYSELLALAASRGVARSTGEAAPSTRQSGQPAGGLDSGVLPLQAATRRFPPPNPRAGRTGVHPQGRQFGAHRQNGRGQNRISLGTITQGRREWLSGSVQAQDLFDEMSFHRRSGFAQTLAALGSSRSDRGRRTWVPQSGSRADESFLQTHGRALPAQAHDHHHN